MSISLVTHSATPETDVVELAERLMVLPTVAGVRWLHNDGLAEVATGEEVRRWGDSTVRSRLTMWSQSASRGLLSSQQRGSPCPLSDDQEALGEPGGATLVDLYCGVGAIGLVLASGYQRVVGGSWSPRPLKSPVPTRRRPESKVSGTPERSRIFESDSMLRGTLSSTLPARVFTQRPRALSPDLRRRYWLCCP